MVWDPIYLSIILNSLNYLSVFIYKTQTNIELALRARFRDASAGARRETVNGQHLIFNFT